MNEPELIIIHDLNDTPDFQNVAEEAEFWNTHGLAAGMMTRENAAVAESAGYLPPARDRGVSRDPEHL